VICLAEIECPEILKTLETWTGIPCETQRKMLVGSIAVVIVLIVLKLTLFKSMPVIHLGGKK